MSEHQQHQQNMNSKEQELPINKNEYVHYDQKKADKDDKEALELARKADERQQR